jgi:hypothetical protein
MRMFVAGATGVIERPRVAPLLEAGHEVTGMIRSAAAQLTAQGRPRQAGRRTRSGLRH